MEEENTGGQAQAPREEEGRNRKKRSAVWEHFEPITDVHGEDKAKCKNCHAELVADSKRHGTKHLMRHIKSCQKQGGERRGKRPTSPPPLAAPRESSNCSKPEPDREEATADLARMIALHGYDPSIVEDSYFRSFVSRLNPDFQVPSRAAIEDICDGIFDEANRDFKSELERSSGEVSLALDTAKTVEGTVSYVACHFIDDEWNRHEMILDAYMIAASPHFVRGPALGISLEEDDLPETLWEFMYPAADNYGISYRICSVTDALGKMVRTPGCDPDECIDTFYDGRYADMVLHSIASCLHDNLERDFMVKEQYSLDDRQFWCLPRQKRAEVLSQLGLDDIGAYNKEWYSCYCSLQVLHKYSTETSVFTELLRKIWGEIYRASKTVSDRPAANLCLRELFKIRELLQIELEGASGDKAAVYEDDNGFDTSVSDVLRDAKDILDMELQKVYLGWSIPLVLDPRYKLEYIIFSFKRAFDSNSENNISKVTTKIKHLFTQYSKYGGGTTDGDPDHAIEMAVHSADPLEQAWDEHCRLQDIDSYLHADTELDLYLRDCRVPRTDGFDILNWWKVNSSKYPTVARMARDYLAMPTCSKLSSEKISQIRSMVRGYSKKPYRP